MLARCSGEFIHQVLKWLATAAAGCPDSQMMFSPYQLKATPLAPSSSSNARGGWPGRALARRSSAADSASAGRPAARRSALTRASSWATRLPDGAVVTIATGVGLGCGLDATGVFLTVRLAGCTATRTQWRTWCRVVQRTTVLATARGAAASTGVELRVSPAVTSKATTPGPRREAMNDMQLPPSEDAGTYNPSPSGRVAPSKGCGVDCDTAVEGSPLLR